MRLSAKTAIKLALASMGLALASHHAEASIIPASSGNGELTLNIFDTTTNSSYSLDLGLGTNQAIALQGSQTFTASSAGDANLAAFLTASAGHTLSWAVVGGAFDPNAAITTSKFVSTTGNAAPDAQSNSTLSGYGALDTNLIAGLNGRNPGDTNGAVNGSYFALAGENGNYSAASGADSWYGNANFITTAAVGQSQAFYSLVSTALNETRGEKNKNDAVTLLGQFALTISGGVATLSYQSAQAAPVPLPAAVWLLGSGLLGFAGIGRRRKA